MFGRDRLKNRDRTGKMLQNPGYLGAIFQIRLEYQNLSSYLFLAYNIHLFLQKSFKKISENCIFVQFSNYFLNFAPLPIFGLHPLN